MSALHPDEVRAQVVRICNSVRFQRAPLLQQLLTFIVEHWLADGGERLTEKFIGSECLKEAPRFEEDRDKFGYPKARANMRHVRRRLMAFYETDGYHDAIIVKLNVGSYVPVIDRNPRIRPSPPLDVATERLLLRAKTALDARTLRGALRATFYFSELCTKETWPPRLCASLAFIPLATAAMVPYTARRIYPYAAGLIEKSRQDGADPWESTFAEACMHLSFHHDWQRALSLFQKAVETSQQEAASYWWYPAVLASAGRFAEAIDLVDSAVRHFARTSIGARADLALLQTMAGQYDDAEETLSAALDFASPAHPALACAFCLLYEAQDRLEDAERSLSAWLADVMSGADLSAFTHVAAAPHLDLHPLAGGLLTYLAFRVGPEGAGQRWLDSLLGQKAATRSSVGIAIGLIGAGRHEDAISVLQHAALEDRDPLTIWFHIFPPLRHLRGDARFQALLTRLNLQTQRIR